MKKKLKKLITILTVVMTVTAVFTMKTHAISLDYSGGSSSINTGATATTSGFTVSYDKAKDNICGYRFSVVSSSGTPKSGTKAVNVYLSDITIGNTAYSSGQRFIVSSGVVANKKQLANGTKVSSITSTQGCDYKSGSCGFYSSLPQNPDSIGTWIKNSSNNYQNLSRIYVICGTNLSNASESDYVLTEPIFRMKLAGVQTSATATELAIYGANVSGGDGYNGGNGRLYNAGSGTLWNLMNYINREFPNALYVSSDTAVYKAVSAKSSGRYAYKDIVKNGYGCSVLTVKNIITIKKDYTDTINHWAWGFNGNGNNGNRDAFKIAVTTFTKKNGDVFTLAEANAAAIPNGFYLNNTYQIGASSVDGTWRNYPYGTKFTQKNNSMGFEYDYHPYNYNITYDLDGGVNNPNNPTGYNVLYGKNLYAAAKAGYEFLGWMRDFTNSQITLTSQNKEDPTESKPIGRIEYLHTDGKVRESIEYTSPYQLEKDVKEENHYGVPMSVVLYKQADGTVVPHEYIAECDPPLQGFSVIDSPFLNKSLAARLVDFYKDYDYYDYQDSLEVGDTDEDAIKRMESDLTKPEAVVSLLSRLKETASGSDLSSDQKAELEYLIGELEKMKSPIDIAKEQRSEKEAREKERQERIKIRRNKRDMER